MSHHASPPPHPVLIDIMKKRIIRGSIGSVICGVVTYFAIEYFHSERDTAQRLVRQKQAEREERRAHLPATGQLDDIKADFEALGFDPERLPSYVLDKA